MAPLWQRGRVFVPGGGTLRVLQGMLVLVVCLHATAGDESPALPPWNLPGSVVAPSAADRVTEIAGLDLSENVGSSGEGPNLMDFLERKPDNGMGAFVDTDAPGSEMVGPAAVAARAAEASSVDEVRRTLREEAMVEKVEKERVAHMFHASDVPAKVPDSWSYTPPPHLDSKDENLSVDQQEERAEDEAAGRKNYHAPLAPPRSVHWDDDALPQPMHGGGKTSPRPAVARAPVTPSASMAMDEPSAHTPRRVPAAPLRRRAGVVRVKKAPAVHPVHHKAAKPLPQAAADATTMKFDDLLARSMNANDEAQLGEVGVASHELGGSLQPPAQTRPIAKVAPKARAVHSPRYSSPHRVAPPEPRRPEARARGMRGVVPHSYPPVATRGHVAPLGVPHNYDNDPSRALMDDLAGLVHGDNTPDVDLGETPQMAQEAGGYTSFDSSEAISYDDKEAAAVRAARERAEASVGDHEHHGRRDDRGAGRSGVGVKRDASALKEPEAWEKEAEAAMKAMDKKEKEKEEQEKKRSANVDKAFDFSPSVKLEDSSYNPYDDGRLSQDDVEKVAATASHKDDPQLQKFNFLPGAYHPPTRPDPRLLMNLAAAAKDAEHDRAMAKLAAKAPIPRAADGGPAVPPVTVTSAVKEIKISDIAKHKAPAGAAKHRMEMDEHPASAKVAKNAPAGTPPAATPPSTHRVAPDASTKAVSHKHAKDTEGRDATNNKTGNERAPAPSEAKSGAADGSSHAHPQPGHTPAVAEGRAIGKGVPQPGHATRDLSVNSQPNQGGATVPTPTSGAKASADADAHDNDSASADHSSSDSGDGSKAKVPAVMVGFMPSPMGVGMPGSPLAQMGSMEELGGPPDMAEASAPGGVSAVYGIEAPYELQPYGVEEIPPEVGMGMLMQGWD